MILANYHTHTQRCLHAVGEDRQYVEEAIDAGMKVLGFSDHCPWIFPKGYHSPTRMRPDELDSYFYSLLQLKKEYQRDITIYIGFEAEYVPEMMESQIQLLADYPVNYMILGEHYTKNEMSAIYCGTETKSESVLKEYVDMVIEGMETGRYRYVAHPDLLHYTGDEVIYRKHFTRLCQYLKDHNIPIEINLLGFKEHRHYPSDKFLSIAQEVGNTAIIGCDAHAPDQLSNQKEIQNCVHFAKRYGFQLVEYLPGLGSEN